MNTGRCPLRISALIVGLLLAPVLSTPPVQAHGNSLVWGTVPSPNHGSLDNALLGISAVAGTDIWAVGEYNPGLPPTVTGRRTLTEHWDGRSWHIVPSPNASFPHVSASHLTGVDALAVNDVWAVGYGEDFSSLTSRTLILHWDGMRWSTVPSPNPGGTNQPNQLSAIDGVTATDVWAVGAAGFPETALILHWNGASWDVVPNQCTGPLAGVVALSAQNVWAVGDTTSCHYDGIGWSTVPIALPGGQNEINDPLVGVAASSPNDVWAVGNRVFEQGESFSYAPLVEHWTGSTWTAMTAVPGMLLNGVAALTPTNVYAVGTDGTYGVVGHWDGQTWTMVPSPRTGQGGVLQAIEAVTQTNLWAVGSVYGTAGGTLVEQAPSRTQGTLSGMVNVSGATVSWFGPVTGSTTTDVYGNFAAAGLPAGAYTVVVAYGSCTPDTATLQVGAGTSVTHTFHLQC